MKLSLPSRLAAIALAVVLAACAAGQKYVDNGKELEAQGDLSGAITQLEAAVATDPGNLAYREQLERAKTAYINQLLQQGDQFRVANQFDAAASMYQKVLAIDPSLPRARDALANLDSDRRHAQLIARAQADFDAKLQDAAMTKLRSVLADDPQNRAALKLKRDIEQADPLKGVPDGLREGLKKQVSLEFHDANIKAVFEALSRSTGVNFVFDREVKPDLKVTVFLQKTTVEDAIGVLTVTNQLDKKYLNDNTVLIYPNTAVKRGDYQELMVKTFYLANADATKMLAMLKTVLKTTSAYADDKLNSITVRDSPEAIQLVGKVIAAQDLAEPEVTLEVEVLEVSRSRLTSLGIDPPSQFTLLNIVPSPTQTVAANGTVVTNTNPVTTTSQLTVANLRSFNGGNIGIPSPQVNIRAELGNTNLLANPRIRVKNRDKAHILIGDKVPVITTTSTANVGVSESVSYLDVGLKLDVEPNVYLNNEVGIKVGLEVSSIVREVTSKQGTLTYQLGTRSATTELRLADGETQALAGLINDQERHATAGIPGFADIPIINRLFATTNDQHDKTEIVLLITPHIVRNINYSSDTPLEYAAGTESSSGTKPLQLRASATISAPPLGDISAVSSRGARGAAQRAGADAAPVLPTSPPIPLPPDDVDKRDSGSANAPPHASDASSSSSAPPAMSGSPPDLSGNAPVPINPSPPGDAAQ